VLKVRQQACGSTARCSLGIITRGIVQTEGVLALWSGLRPTLIMSIPGTVLYMSAYEEIRSLLASSNSKTTTAGFTWLSPMVSGGAARIVTSTVVSPLELLRTRLQAGPSAAFISSTIDEAASPTLSGTPRAAVTQAVIPALRAVVEQDGVAGLWRGLGPTLLRDVPFSCLYWLGYERIKAIAVARSSDGRLSPVTSFFAGAASGTVAAFVTTPLDVIKTRQQLRTSSHTSTKGPLSQDVPSQHASFRSERMPSRTQVETSGASAVIRATGMPTGNSWRIVTNGYPLGTAAEILHVARTEGVRALFAGVGPRLLKVAPSCAVMICSYELGKRYFETRSNRHCSDA